MRISFPSFIAALAAASIARADQQAEQGSVGTASPYFRLSEKEGNLNRRRTTSLRPKSPEMATESVRQGEIFSMNDPNDTTGGSAATYHAKDSGKGSSPSDETSQIEISIVGGQQSDVGEFPYYVDMEGCGGTLIAPNVVITAAHCGNFQGRTIFVSGYQLGTTNNGAMAVQVVEQRTHPNYRRFTNANDFALLRLDRNVFPTGGVTLTVNNDGGVPFTGQDVTTLGLGTTSSGGQQAQFLRDVVVQAVSDQSCGSFQSYGNQYNPDNMLCAGVQGGGRDSCQGDSGGPLVVRNGNNHVLVGVVSWGNGCGEANFPGVYARVSSAFGWIQQVVCDSFNPSADLCGASGGGGGGGTGTGSGGGGGGGGGVPAPPVPQPQPPAPPVGCAMLRMTLDTDNFPQDNSFFLESDGQGVIWDESNFNANTQYYREACLPRNGCSTFDFTDDGGDGLRRQGNLRVEWDGDVLFNGWRVGFGLIFDLGDNCRPWWWP